jgi:hypothetical protein
LVSAFVAILGGNAESSFSSLLTYYYQAERLCNSNKEGETGMQKTEAYMTPAEHAQHIANLLQQAQQECRADIGRIDDPKAQALFETAAEVMGGLLKALEHYQTGSEPAWQHSSGKQETGQRPKMEHMPESQRLPPQGPQPLVVTDMAADISEDHPPPKLHTE